MNATATAPLRVTEPVLGPLRGDEFATERGYSDSHPYEIIARTKNTLTLRAMKATRDQSVKLEFSVGGFAAHCSNQSDQRWFLQSDPDGAVVKAHLRTSRKSRNLPGFYISGCNRVSLGVASKFYDYNF